ncbi:MAG: MFS transporter [Myxococcales bacterium]|jgi:Na+/melibiose symporter-like transporter
MRGGETGGGDGKAALRDRLPFGVLFSYGLPRLGMGVVAVPVALHVAKFGTDVLLIPPAAMAAIHSIARVWATKAFADVFRNRHARLVLLIYGIDTLGAGAIITLTPYVTEYVVRDMSLATGLSLAFLLPQTLLVPLWIALARRRSRPT